MATANFLQQSWSWNRPRNGSDAKCDINILVLGETGVGKSTFINSFINYILFDSFDDALAHPRLEYLVPLKFSIGIPAGDDDDGDGFRYVDINLTAGQQQQDTELNGSSGQSATRKPKVYKIALQDGTICIIDTPGVGDTRGAGQDALNMTALLDTLSHLEELHGIIILLRPTQSRLILTFRYCVEELLLRLHRNAATNIVFGFTNTRTSDYTPGETLQPLRAHLGQEKFRDCLVPTRGNLFAFESESFRHLAAAKHSAADAVELPNRSGARES